MIGKLKGIDTILGVWYISLLVVVCLFGILISSIITPTKLTPIPDPNPITKCEAATQPCFISSDKIVDIYLQHRQEVETIWLSLPEESTMREAVLIYLQPKKKEE